MKGEDILGGSWWFPNKFDVVMKEEKANQELLLGWGIYLTPEKVNMVP